MPMRKLTPFLVLAAVLLFPALALAGDGSSSSATPKNISDWVAVLVGGAVLAIGERLWGLISHKRGAAKVAKQLDIHAIEQLIADEAIDYVDELVHRASKPGGKVLTSIEKAAEARGYADQMAKARKLGKDSAERIAKILLARLGASRKAPSSGALATRMLR